MGHPSAFADRRAAIASAASRTAKILQRALIGLSAIVIALCIAVLGVFVFNPRLAEEFTSGLRPTLFLTELPPDLIDPGLEDQYEGIIGIAHNSGDSVPATLTALANGADAIELDVVSLDGKLYSSHASPLPLIGSGVFRGPSLEMIWAAAAQTDLVKFDLKESSPQFRTLVLRFLSIRRREHQVVIASNDRATLRFFAERMPELILVYSAGNRERLTTLQEDPDLVALVDGVTIRHSLVDEETAAWLDEHELLMIAWTVNDLERANELIRLGADAITTDNLSLLALFGGQRRGEEPLDAGDATPVPTETAVPVPNAPNDDRRRLRTPVRPAAAPPG